MKKFTNGLALTVAIVLVAFVAGGIILPARFEKQYSEVVPGKTPTQVFNCLATLENLKPMFGYNGMPGEKWDANEVTKGDGATANISTPLVEGGLRYSEYKPHVRIAARVSGKKGPSEIKWVIGQNPEGTVVDTELKFASGIPFLSGWIVLYRNSIYPADSLSIVGSCN